MRLLTAAFAAFVLLSGCKTTGISGEGPIVFTLNAVKTFDSYISREDPTAFAITRDGTRGFYYYCPWNAAGACEHLADTQVLYYCEESAGEECLIFAKKREIVWENPGDWRNGIPDGKYLVNHSDGNQ